MTEDEEEEGKCDPEPADLDEPDVEEVALLGEVGRCLRGFVALFVRVVWAEAMIDRDGAEQTPQ